METIGVFGNRVRLSSGLSTWSSIATAEHMTELV